MSYYKDLREYVGALEAHAKLVRIKREINKDTELMPLVRWQFRGLPEPDRKAFFFDKIIDVKGRRYDTPVLVASHAPSRSVYALAMQCSVEEIPQKWEQAQAHPVKPELVKRGPVEEEVHTGKKLLEHGGLEEFPIPISTPGFDNGPYFSAGNCISRDPETGIRNIGTYRCMVKSPQRIGLGAQLPKHIRQHWVKWKKKGAPMPVAISIGPTPNIGLVSATNVPYGVDEYDVAGGIAGEPVEMVKCRTVDLEVPATSEVVIEGEVPTDFLEREGPFGEYTGYMAIGKPTLFMNVTCIMHRKKPVWNGYLSEFPPSESSVMRKIGGEATYYRTLKRDLGIDCVSKVTLHENSGGWLLCIVSMKNAATPQVWQALYGVTAASALYGKIVIAVDDDIDPEDLDSVAWALCYRMQPNRDIHIANGKLAALDPSAAPPEKLESAVERPPSSTILIDGTRKWPYPPTSLPRKEFMERARQIWEEEGLPPLTPKAPWFGTALGYWPREIAEEAELALKGEHYKTGEKLAKQRLGL